MSLSLPALQWLQDGYAGFAWPWAWLVFPLPWLVRWAWPPRRAQADALRVPYGHAVQAIAAQGGRGLAGRGSALAWLVWFLLCAAVARPQQFGDAVTPPASGRAA